MKFSNSILAKLFGSKLESVSEEELQGNPELMEQMKEELLLYQEGTKASLPPAEANELVLSIDHALKKLHDLWEEQIGGQPSVRLLMDGTERFSDKELELELGRLNREITLLAEARLKEAVPEAQKPAKDRKDVQEREDAEKGQENQEIPHETGEEERENALADLDALPFVFIASDKLTAWLMIFPPVGNGKEIRREDIEKALKDRSVAYGIDEKLLDSLPDDRERYFHLYKIAEGTPAVNGEDGQIREFFDRHVRGEVVIDDRGRVDYASLNLIQSVEEGAVICEALPPTKATPGRTVLDEPVPGKDGKAATLPKGQNTQINKEGNLLLASRSGSVEYSGRVFQVKSVMDVKGNVDYSTGNINFPGDVHICGDVCSGFAVRSVGSITVDGVVEAGTVEAGGDLVIVKGIVGNKESIIRANRNIYTKYLENGIIHARGNLVTECILHSDVYCDGEVQVTSGRGAIIGGRIRAAQSVLANTVGSKSESITTVILGGQPCADFERALLRQNIEDLEEEMMKLERQPESPAKAKRMGKIRLDLSVSRMKIGQFDKEKEKLEGQLEEQGGCRMRCQIAYPGILLTIGNETIQVTQEVSSCNARLVDGEICLM